MEASKEDLLDLFELRELDPSDPFDRELRRTMDRIDRAFLKYPSKSELRWSERAGSHASHVTGIGINREQLEVLVEQFGPEWRELLYAVILSHEKAHMLQYDQYGTLPYRSHPGRVMEIQADIIAASYVVNGPMVTYMEKVGREAAEAGRPITDVVERFNEYAQELSELIPTLMRGMGSMGANWEDHPTPEQRERAFIDGLMFSSLMFSWAHPSVRRDLFEYPEEVAHLIPNQIPEEEFRERTGLREGEDFLHWSLRQAYGRAGLPFVETEDLPDTSPQSSGRSTIATHSAAEIPESSASHPIDDPQAAIEVGVIHIEWNAESEGGPLEFILELYNTTRRPVEARFVVESGYVPRNANDERAFRVYRAKVFDIRIDPRGRKRVEGSLPWWATEEYTPSWRERFESASFTGDLRVPSPGAVKLIEAGAAGEVDAVRSILASGTPVNARADWMDDAEDVHEDVTALYTAILSGNEDLALELIQEHGAEVGLTYGDSGRGALHHAAQNGMPRLVRLIVSKGVAVGWRDSDGDTPLHLAAWYGAVDCIQALAALGADLEARDDGLRTPLMRAARGSEAEAIGVLLELGADLHAEDRRGENSLVHAIRAIDEPCIDLLVKKGLSLQAKATNGRSAIDILAELIEDAEKDVQERPTSYRVRELRSLEELQMKLLARK